VQRRVMIGAVLALAALAAGRSALAGTRVDLDGPWAFRIDPDGQGEARGWSRAVAEPSETVDVPHTWGVGPHAEHEGVAWYWRRVEVPPALRGRHLELHFGAVFYKARVFVDGVLAGEHEGGHTPWFLDVTRLLGDGALLAVAVDNRPGVDTIPGWAMRLSITGTVWYDWWHYGGLVRDVALVAQERAAIRRQEIRTKLQDGTATVTTRAFLESFGGRRPYELEASLTDPSGRDVGALRTRVVPGRGPTPAELAFRVASPELWHFDRPRLYSLRLALRDASGTLMDERTDRLGIRTVEVRDRGLWLNGERVRLTGITRHEDSPWEGLAETRGTMKADWDDLKSLQVVLTRPVHYPQHPYILDYADSNGVLLVPEIPMWQFSEDQMKDPRVLALAKRMMREMIEQDFNHPSIVGWSVCNESATNTAGGREYVKAMRDHVKSLDPDRLVSYADDGLARASDASENANQYTDFIMMNQYYGSWAGPAEGLAPALEHVGTMFPDKALVISEFGLAGLFAPTTEEADAMRVRVLEDQLAEFQKHDFVAGAIFWCYQDYKSHRNLWPGETSGWVEMGLVDENRRPHPSYDAWRERNAPARIEPEWTRGQGERPTGFKVSVEQRPPGEIPSYALSGYRLEWRAVDHDRAVLAEGAKDLPEIGPPATVEGTWPATSTREIRLTLRLVRPTGFVAAERTERWWEPRSGGLSPEEARRRGLAAPEP
jgi:beta-glucuronidase